MVVLRPSDCFCCFEKLSHLEVPDDIALIVPPALELGLAGLSPAVSGPPLAEPMLVGDLIALIVSDLGATRSVPEREFRKGSGAAVLRFSARKPTSARRLR
jgi:hypothetical protein